jgi:hypothetical protein
MTSPLNEADVTSMNILMSRDPETYTRQDLDQIIAVYRDARKRFREAELAEKAPKAKKAAKAPLEAATVDELANLLDGL